MPRRASQHCLDNHRNPDGSLQHADGQGHCMKCRRERNHEVFLEKRRFIRDHKMASGCVECGYRTHPDALHLHHRDPSGKEMEVSRIRRYGWEKIRAEIAKCEVICANCHAEHHARARD